MSKRKIEPPQVTVIRNETGDVIIGSGDIKKVIRKYYDHLTNITLTTSVKWINYSNNPNYPNAPNMQ